jgi:glutamine amidotransferase
MHGERMENNISQYDAVLIDAGTGNLHSVENALRSLGYKLLVTASPDDLRQPGRVILPGVGAFGAFMQGLRAAGLDAAVQEVFRRGDPLLGICVGMQAFFESGEELGTHAGMALLPGKVIHFPDFSDLKVPHTGWNQLHFTRPAPLFAGLESGCYAYFNHSFYCAAADPRDALAVTDYGIDFTSAVQRDNLLAVQFHPEKSQQVGKKILENFFRI